MRVSFTNGPNGNGFAVYTTDQHYRDGEYRYRQITVEREFVYTPLLRRQAVHYRIVHTEYSEHGPARVIMDGGVSRFSAALDVLGRELRRCIDDGYASKADLERLPSTADVPEPVAALP